MLNKLVKIIEVAAIIGLNGLNLWGNRIDVFYEGGPTLVAERIDGKKLPEELSDPNHYFWNEYNSYVKWVGIRLNLPQDLIDDCEDDYWKIKDKSLIQELEEIVSTEENFHLWCDQQKNFDEKNSQEIQYLLHLYAYVLKKANEKNYCISKDFCKQVDFRRIMGGIHLKGATLCLYGLAPKTPAEYYLRDLKWIMNYTFFEEESESLETDDDSTILSFLKI